VLPLLLLRLANPLQLATGRAGIDADLDRYPSDYKGFLLDKMTKLDAEKYPNLTGSPPLMLDARTAFQEGLRLFVLGLEREPKLKHS